MITPSMPPGMKQALEEVKKILDQNRNPMSAADVDHQYEDKYDLVEFMTNTGIAATLNVLDQLDGFNQEILQKIILVVQEQKRSMTLRLAIEEDCEFLEETTRTVESPTSSHLAVHTATGDGTPTEHQVFTHKIVTQVKEYRWKAGIRHTLLLFAGTDASAGIVLGTRAGSTTLVTKMKKYPYPPQTRHPVDLDLTWLVNQIHKDTLVCSFQIDREQAKTPRRNKQTEACLEFVNNLSKWLHRASFYFRGTVQRELLGGHPDASPPAQWLARLDRTGIFSPVLPLFQEYAKGEVDGEVEQEGLVSLPSPPVGSPVIPLNDTTLFLKEQCRTLQNALLGVMGNFPDPADHGQLISGYEAKLVILFLHLADVAVNWEQGIMYVETMLFDQLIMAVGKQVRSEDFADFLKFHNKRLLGKNYTPKPFCHAIRQPNQYPDGVLSITAMKAGHGAYGNSLGGGDAIETFSHHIPGDSVMSPISIPLNAATTVDFLGDQYLHGWMDTQFSGEQTAQHFISARARQFSCFLLMVGSISGPEEFTPKDAIILQNKDEVLIPLLTTSLPSAKEFRDAIQSMSPEQARFAKSFRSMQLDSSVFGICVIQVKPQMEALLALPSNSLQKEIQLTQDLLSLFVDYQIPPNLVSYDGDDRALVADKVASVMQHTKGVLDVIKAIKEAQLAEETRNAKMREEKAKEAQPAEEGEIYIRADGTKVRRIKKNRAGDNATFFAGNLTQGLDLGEIYLRADGKKVRRVIKKLSAQAQTLEGMQDAPDPAHPQTLPVARATVALSGGSIQHVSNLVKESLEAELVDFGFEGLDSLRDQLEDLNLKKVEGKEEVWTVPSLDFTAIPKKLDRMFETFDKDGALRTMTLKTGDNWTRSQQENLLTKLVTTKMSADTKKNESNKALDLLDALSCSGSLPVSAGELHVIVGIRHSFENNILDTVIKDNVNPIEKVDYSTLLIAASIHQVSISTLLANSADPPALVLKNCKFPPKMLNPESNIDGTDDL